MPCIIEFPTLVQQAVEQFGSVFANEPERCHFAEYLTGLIIVAKKNVTGINSEFAETIVLENDVVFGSVNANRRHYEQAAEALAGADRGQFLIDFRELPEAFPHYSFTVLLAGEIDPDVGKDKIVLIGVTAEQADARVVWPVKRT